MMQENNEVTNQDVVSQEDSNKAQADDGIHSLFFV